MKLPFRFLTYRRPADAGDPLTSDEIQQLVTPVVERVLQPLGFELQKALRWVESGNVAIRRMFCLLPFKGGTLVPSWGFSLDYVPHISGSQVKWHRTAKSAMLDLRTEARDPRMELYHLWGAKRFTDDLATAIPLSTGKAMELWDSVATIADLPAAFEQTKRYLAQGDDLGFYNYVQNPIAYAFTLARLGETAKAQAELEQFCYLRSPDADPVVAARIRKLFAEAGR